MADSCEKIPPADSPTVEKGLMGLKNGLDTDQGLESKSGTKKVAKMEPDTKILYKVYQTPPIYMTVMLALQVSPSDLINVCQLIYRNNDIDFKCYVHF